MAESASNGRMRLTILGGYLGSGKTTWLRHQLHEGAFGRVHVVVNEAAEVPVDDALLGAADGLTLLAGGCCCCVGRAAMIAALRVLCDRRSGMERERVERIVLETSGLADPGAILTAIQADPVLTRHIRVTDTVVLADALHCLDQLRTEPLGRRQVEAADRIVLSKVDAAGTADLSRLRATLGVLNPAAAISGAVRGEVVDLAELRSGAQAEVLAPLGAGDARGPIVPTRLRIEVGVDWSAFTLWLSALLHARGHDLVRVKGVVATPAGRLLVQTVRKVVQSPEILPGQAGDARDDDTIVFLGRGYQPEDLERSLRYFACSEARIRGVRPDRK